MKQVILYPTETIYALGVNAFDQEALQLLADIKGRSVDQAVSCLVRSVADIEKYAQVDQMARKLMEAFLPGPLTIELVARPEFVGFGRNDERIGFRISPDPIAQQTVERFMAEHNAPLTCTSSNMHGHTPADNPEDILLQLGDKAGLVTMVVDDGIRTGVASTVISCINNEVKIIREGAIRSEDIWSVVNS